MYGEDADRTDSPTGCESPNGRSRLVFIAIARTAARERGNMTALMPRATERQDFIEDHICGEADVYFFRPRPQAPMAGSATNCPGTELIVSGTAASSTSSKDNPTHFESEGWLRLRRHRGQPDDGRLHRRRRDSLHPDDHEVGARALSPRRYYFRGDHRGRGSRERAAAPGTGADLADPGRRRGEPEPGGRQRGAAGHRQGLRRRPGGAQPGRGRVLARARCIGALPRRGGRPLRPQAAPSGRHRPRDPGLASGGVRAVDRGPVRRPDHGRPCGRARLPDHARPDHRAVVGPGADEVDRALVRARRGDLVAGPAPRRRDADPVRLGLGVPDHVAPGGGGALSGASAWFPPMSTRPPTRSTTSAASSRC